MKRILVRALTAIIIATLFISCTACGLFDDGKVVVTITHAQGTVDVRVEKGGTVGVEQSYLPEKKGYDLLGWFDAEEGGTKYIDSKGKNVKTIEKKVTLYPQFEAQHFVLMLSAPNGTSGLTTTEFEVAYDDPLPDIPLNITLEHHTFNGWFTKENGGGKRVTTSSSVIPTLNKVTYDNFELDDQTRLFYFFADFSIEIHTVTLKFDGYPDETVEVPYGTPLSSVMYKTRNGDGYGVKSWSQTQGGNAFTDNITGNTTLYASDDWAPIITFDYQGGDFGGSWLVAYAGDDIVLPTPQKMYSKFMGWQDERGNSYTSTTMPNESKKLTATWQGVLVFDENGGTQVDDISEAPNTVIELPKPTKSGYVFAGWYGADGKQYAETKMPYEGMLLKAGWCEEKTTTITWLKDDEYKYIGDPYYFWYKSSNNNINLTGYHEVKLVITFECKHYSSSQPILGFDGFSNLVFGIYSEQTTNSEYALLPSKTYPHENVQSYREYEISATITIKNGVFYMAMDSTGAFGSLRVRRLKAEMTYPDLTTLQL